MTKASRQQFIDTVWDNYARHGRYDLPWRKGTGGSNFPYHVLVSEIMLQQTQVNRVIEKFNLWLEAFPTLESVANAPFSDCLALWSGLGYNRRVRFLQQACKEIATTHKGVVPSNTGDLVALPGIGVNTAAAVAVYAYNMPVVFIETNIRTVFIHHFFTDQENVHDTEILRLVKETLDSENSREWYWALMDYGSVIKQRTRLNSQSAHYTKQSKFEGSRRQVRGIVLKVIQSNPQTLEDLKKNIQDDRLEEVLITLEREGFIAKTGVTYAIARD